MNENRTGVEVLRAAEREQKYLVALGNYANRGYCMDISVTKIRTNEPTGSVTKVTTSNCLSFSPCFLFLLFFFFFAGGLIDESRVFRCVPRVQTKSIHVAKCLSPRIFLLLTVLYPLSSHTRGVGTTKRRREIWRQPCFPRQCTLRSPAPGGLQLEERGSFFPIPLLSLRAALEAYGKAFPSFVSAAVFRLPLLGRLLISPGTPSPVLLFLLL